MKLKPCPLCGGKAIGYWHTVYGEKIYCIECEDCELSFAGIKKEKAEEDWNKRENMPKVVYAVYYTSDWIDSISECIDSIWITIEEAKKRKEEFDKQINILIQKDIEENGCDMTGYSESIIKKIIIGKED